MSCRVCSAMGRTCSICDYAPVVMRTADGVDVTGYQVEIEKQRTRIAALEGLVGELVKAFDTEDECNREHSAPYDHCGCGAVPDELRARIRAALNGGGADVR